MYVYEHAHTRYVYIRLNVDLIDVHFFSILGEFSFLMLRDQRTCYIVGNNCTFYTNVWLFVN